ncbi:hypothetical protein DL93DRAFT_615749 [Clavulina sp. PMI_390]|nr:hypothetical protein DL93DRAFT_615749 [Clavulina sp. PMI_390]
MLRQTLRRVEQSAQCQILPLATKRSALTPHSLPTLKNKRTSIPRRSIASSSRVRAEPDDGLVSSIIPSRTRAEPLAVAANSFTRAISNKDVLLIRHVYPIFKESFLESGPGGRSIFSAPATPPSTSMFNWTRKTQFEPILPPKTLHEAISFLLRAGGHRNAALPSQDVKLAADMLLDMIILYKLEPPSTLIHSVVLALSKLDANEAVTWLRKLEEAQGSQGGNFDKHYATVIVGLGLVGDVEGMQSVLEAVRNHPRLSPSITLWTAYICALGSGRFRGPPVEMELAIQEMKRTDGFEPNLPIISELMFRYQASNDLDGSKRHVDTLRTLLHASESSTSLDPADISRAMSALIRHEVLTSGYDAGLLQALALRRAGLPLDSHVIRPLMDAPNLPLLNAESLQSLAETLDIELGGEIWSELLSRTARRDDGLPAALDLYDEMKRRDIFISKKGADRLIYALCGGSEPPTVESVEQALDVYYDLRDNYLKQISRRVSPKRLNPPDFGIFMSLLRSIIRTGGPSQETIDLVYMLLSDMKYFSIRLEPSFMESLLPKLFRVCTSQETALKLWNHIRDIDPVSLDESGYSAVLEEFSKLSFPNDPLPSLPSYLEIIKTMRENDIPVTSYIYNILFRRYATLAKEIIDESYSASSERAEELDQRRLRILDAVKKLHVNVRMDAMLVPTTSMMNGLMWAYSHLGAYQEAFTVWDELAYGRPGFDHASLSIALDVCGFAGDSGAADKVWRRARTMKPSKHHPPFVPNENNWTSLIECRARTGRYESAVSAFKEMLTAEDRATTPLPDLKCATVMLRFAGYANDTERISRLIQNHLPDIYQQLQEVEEQKLKPPDE